MKKFTDINTCYNNTQCQMLYFISFISFKLLLELEDTFKYCKKFGKLWQKF